MPQVNYFCKKKTMIQRIQSIWLLLASVCTFLTYKFPVYSGTNAKGVASYPLNANENLVLLLLTILTGALVFLTIFLFKKRKLQIRLCILAIFLQVALFFLYFTQIKSFTQGVYALTAVLPIFSLLFLALAVIAINKDEKLVKNSDRLR
jgi:peptidoglycan/LPS O-acetylase OafA/YrhL